MSSATNLALSGPPQRFADLLAMAKVDEPDEVLKQSHQAAKAAGLH